MDAFSAFRMNYVKHNPDAEGFDEIDLEEMFRAGFASHRQVVWHDSTERAKQGKTIVTYDGKGGTCEIYYTGGGIAEGSWAYAEDLFNEDMMDTVLEREAELAAWFEEEARRQINK